MMILISPINKTDCGIAITKKPMKEEYIFKTWKELKMSSEYPISRLFVAELMKEVKRKPEALYYNVYKG